MSSTLEALRLAQDESNDKTVTALVMEARTLRLQLDDLLRRLPARTTHSSAAVPSVPDDAPREAVLGVVRALRARIAALEQDAVLATRRAQAAAQSDPRLAPITKSLQTLADTLPQIVWITYPDGYHKYYNRHWWEYTGLTYEEAKGSGWNILLHPDDRLRSIERWTHSLRSGEDYDIEYRFRRASDGMYRWFLGRARPRRDERGEIIEWFGTCTDIHDQKVAQETMHRANVAKDEFLATISHELRTPLNAILGWAQLMKLGRMSDEERARAVLVIEKNAKIQTQLVEDMLDVSRIINGKLRIEKEPVQAAAVIDGAVATVAPLAASKHIALEHREVDRDVWVDGDPDRLQQIVWNLLNNAIKFTPDGGGVAVRLARESSYARIDVLDTGSGIALDFLPHVFERFRQGDAASTRRVGGLGLGLSIVKSLVELHGGTVDVASDGPGHGATFRVWLPVRAVKPERAAVISMARPTAVHEHSLRGVRCLVVDDEASAREVIAATLAGHGADVSTAVDVPAGVESFLRLRPHVLVSDIAMPGATGHDLVRRIRALSGDEGKDTPALALTAYASVQDRHDALDAGFDWHLSKPVEPAELVAVVMELAGRGKTRAAR